MNTKTNVLKTSCTTLSSTTENISKKLNTIRALTVGLENLAIEGSPKGVQGNEDRIREVASSIEQLIDTVESDTLFLSTGLIQLKEYI